MRHLLRVQFLKFKNFFTRAKSGDVWKASLFGLFGGLFLLALYFGAYRVIDHVHHVEMVGPLLVAKLLAMVFLSAFFMIAFSATLTSFSTLFFARDLSMLVHTPLPYRALFAFKALETAALASWVTVLALFPLLAAYGRVMDQGLIFFLAVALLAVPFVWMASALGVAVSLSLMCLFPARRVRIVMMTLGVLIGTGIFLWARWMAPTRFLRADSFEKIVQYADLLQAPTAVWLPSWWITSAVTAVAAGLWAKAAAYGALLSVAGIAVGYLLTAFGERAYYGGWARAQENARRRTAVALGGEWRGVPAFFERRLRAMLGKDFIIFRRDANQWSQLLMLLSIVAIYLVSIRKLPLDTVFLKNLVSFLNIGLVGFVLASVSLRFVFPEVSLEGRSWWILRAAPLPLRSILWSKFLLGSIPIAVVGVALVWISNQFLGVDRFILWLSNATVLVMALTLTSMGLGFGALFPRFHVENVAQIQSSAGGILFMAAALFYVFLTMALEAVMMKAYFFSKVAGDALWSWTPVVFALSALAVVNAVAAAVPLWLGHRSLREVDL